MRWRLMHEIWDSRLRCFSALIWWISLRYFSIGWEYVFQVGAASHYWSSFADVLPQAVGGVMVLIGAVGISTQIFSWRTGLLRVPLVMVFAVGVSGMSLFRLTALIQQRRFGDPLLILFLCDFLAMLFILVGLPYSRKILRCH